LSEGDIASVQVSLLSLSIHVLDKGYLHSLMSCIYVVLCHVRMWYYVMYVCGTMSCMYVCGRHKVCKPHRYKGITYNDIVSLLSLSIHVLDKGYLHSPI